MPPPESARPTNFMWSAVARGCAGSRGTSPPGTFRFPRHTRMRASSAARTAVKSIRSSNGGSGYMCRASATLRSEGVCKFPEFRRGGDDISVLVPMQGQPYRILQHLLQARDAIGGRGMRREHIHELLTGEGLDDEQVRGGGAGFHGDAFGVSLQLTQRGNQFIRRVSVLGGSFVGGILARTGDGHLDQHGCKGSQDHH